MNIVLRAAGSSLDVDACLKWIRPDLLIQTWRAGERDALKRVLPTNGFTLDLADDDDRRAALRDAYDSLLAVRDGIAGLVAEGIDVVVDFGMFVYAHAPQTLVIPKPLLAELATLGVEVMVSAYPCSDEE